MLNKIIIYLFIFGTFSSCIFSNHLKRSKAFYAAGIVNTDLDTTTIHLQNYLDLMVVEVKISGETLKFIIDSGAPTTINPEIVEKLGILPNDELKISDVNNRSQTIETVSLPEILIGEFRFNNINAFLINLKNDKYGPFACGELDGIIGANLMRMVDWHFNFDTNEITLTKDNNELEGKTMNIPFSTGFNHIPVFTANIADKSYRLTLDLGSNGFMSLRKSNFQYLKNKQLLSDIGYEIGTGPFGAFGYGKYDTLSYGKINHFKINSNTFNKVSTNFGNYNLIGMKFIRQYNMSISWSKKIIAFSERKPGFAPDYSGFGFNLEVRDNKLIIQKLIYSEQIKNSGLKAGNQVIAINDTRIDEDNLDIICSFYNKSLADFQQPEVRLTVLSGNVEKTVSLKKESKY